MQPNKHIHILIVEDELVIAYALREMLEDMGFSRISIASSAIKANIVLEEQFVSLLLLDINLGKGKMEGIDLALQGKKKDIPCIFVTSYSDKTTMDKAIQNSPIAYLTKPIQPSSLYSAVRIALNIINEKEGSILRVKEGGKTISIPENSILFVHAENNYVKIVTREKNHLLRMSLSSFKDLLNGKHFIQIHRSYLVNLNHVQTVQNSTLTIGHHTLPVSRSYKDRLKEVFSPLTSNR